MNSKDTCICCYCEEELSKGDRFIILSMETGEFNCVKCFIKHELVLTHTPKDVENKLTTPADNIEELKKVIRL